MKKIIYYTGYVLFFAGLLMAASIFGGCGGPAEPQAQTGPAEEEHLHGEGLELSAEQIRTVGIVISGIEKKNLTEVVKSSGQLAVPPQNAAQVNVLSGGIIRKINVIEGQHVNRGQVLVMVENQDLMRLQQEYLTAKSGFSYVEAEHIRQQQLKAAGAGTGKAQQQAEAAYNTERARLKALEGQLGQYGIAATGVAGGKLVTVMPVKAPINGTIGKIVAQTGSYAQPGTSIMEIVDNSKIHADLIVFEKDLSRIRTGQKVLFQLTNQKNEQIEGVIRGINKSFENDSKGVVVHAVISKPGADLIPGMYVTGLIAVGTGLADAVPEDAVVRNSGKSYIFIAEGNVDGIQGKENGGIVHFKKAEVVTGVAELGYIQIRLLQKLPADVRVVTKGAFYLQSKSSGPAEHDH